MSADFRRRSQLTRPTSTTFTVITTGPNTVTAPIHDRMPVILPCVDWSRRLDSATPLMEAKALVRPCPTEWMTAHRVPPQLAVCGTTGRGCWSRTRHRRGRGTCSHGSRDVDRLAVHLRDMSDRAGSDHLRCEAYSDTRPGADSDANLRTRWSPREQASRPAVRVPAPTATIPPRVRPTGGPELRRRVGSRRRVAVRGMPGYHLTAWASWTPSPTPR